MRAYEELVRRHHTRLYRLASVYLADASQAADVTQEVFLRAMRGFRSFLFMAEPATWLYKTTRYVCGEFNRKQQRVVEQGEEAPGPSIENEYSGAQTMAMIKRLVATLPAKQKEVVILRLFEDLSVEETASLMQCRPGTVKAHLFKALRSLREKIRNAEDGMDERGFDE